MQSPAHASCSSGLVRKTLLLSLSLLMSACAQFPLQPYQPPQGASTALAFWSEAIEADASRRASMLRDARRWKAEWQIAMLSSLPGNGGEDVSGSQRALRAVLRQNLPPDQSALARLRLREIEQATACMSNVAELRGRLNQIVDIERQIQNGR
jgi:hypothetical protein